jgi:hypothetical protein
MVFMKIIPKLGGALRKPSMILGIVLVISLAALVVSIALLVTGGPGWGDVDSGEVRTAASISMAILIPLIVVGVFLLWFFHKVARWLKLFYVASALIALFVLVGAVGFIAVRW